MDKINFQNDITKVNAETFNLFQNNIEKAVVPIGGTTKQILAKKNNNDNEVEWIDQVEIVNNVDSTSETDGLSAKQGKILNDRINNISLYTTEEQEIGKWLGNKKIFRKTLYIAGGLTFESNKFIFEHNIQNLQMPIKLSGIIYDSSNRDYYILPYVTTGVANIMLYSSATQIKVEQTAYPDNRLQNLYVIIEYIKETD